MIASLNMYLQMFGTITEDIVVMAKCNCVNCVSCNCVCACNRKEGNSTQIEW